MDKSTIIQLLIGSGCTPDIVDHCRSVASLARVIAERIPGCDPEKAYLGGLIHDIGRSVTHGIIHGVEGGHIGEKCGIAPWLIRIIRNHIGAGITSEEAPDLGLPAEDFMPHSLEEKVVAHADNLLSGTKRRTLKQFLKKLEKKGVQAEIKDRLKDLHEDLSNQAGIDLDLI